jgi:hypothetical protein
MLGPANPFQERHMPTLHRALWVAGLWLATATTVHADVLFSAQLSGAQEMVPNQSSATGSASLVLNDGQNALTYSISVTGLDFTGTQTASTLDNLLAAHIHAPALPGINGPVVFGFFGTPFSETNPNDVLVTPFAAGVGGTISGKWDLTEGNNTTLALQLPNLMSGLAYLNFHTVQFPGGEIRGQILRVPEPGTLGLIGVALGIAGLGRRGRLA